MPLDLSPYTILDVPVPFITAPISNEDRWRYRYRSVFVFDDNVIRQTAKQIGIWWIAVPVPIQPMLPVFAGTEFVVVFGQIVPFTLQIPPPLPSVVSVYRNRAYDSEYEAKDYNPHKYEY